MVRRYIAFWGDGRKEKMSGRPSGDVRNFVGASGLEIGCSWREVTNYHSALMRMEEKFNE